MDLVLRPRGSRVLVVDDDHALAETLAEGLQDRGHDAVAISASKEAARRLESEEVDALVTDLRMPGIDGLGLLQLSRRTAPDRPVIVMTAYGALDTAIESIRQGACHYLTKPFKVDELALFLDRALDDARVRREALVLRRALRDQLATSTPATPTGSPPFDGPVRPLEELDRRYARWALAQLGGRERQTAEALGVDPQTLARLLGDAEERSRGS